MRSRPVGWQRLSNNLLQLEHHADFWKIAQMNHETRHSKYNCALPHAEVRTKPYVYFHEPAYITNHAVC